MKPQARGNLQVGKATCALGAAIDAIDLKPVWTERPPASGKSYSNGRGVITGGQNARRFALLGAAATMAGSSLIELSKLTDRTAYGLELMRSVDCAMHLLGEIERREKEGR